MFRYLSPTDEAASIWVERDCIDRTEMSFHAPELFLVDRAEESNLELSSLRRGGGNGVGILSTCRFEDAMVLCYYKTVSSNKEQIKLD